MKNDSDTPVVKEVENTLNSVVNCHIWITEKLQYDNKLTDTDCKDFHNDLGTGNNLKDPLSFDDDSKKWIKNNAVLQKWKEPLSDNEDESKTDFKKQLKTYVNSLHLHDPSSDCHCDKEELIKDERVVLKPIKRYEESADPIINLTRDALTILETDDKIFQCPHCEYRNNKPGRVSLHIKAKHIKLRRYACTLCNYKATQNCTLQGHIRARHTKEKPYTCMYCSYRAAQAGSLLQHIRVRHLK